LESSIYQVIQKNSFSGFAPDITKKLAIQVLYALVFLKNEGIIHCDLKPENIVFQDSSSDVVKLVDFSSSCFEGGISFFLILRFRKVIFLYTK